MHRRRLTYAILALCLCVWPVAAHGQQETATIVGTVTDGTGAIVPGATVMVTNVQTNISLTTQTDDRGAFAVASLRPGEYSLTVELSGFQKTIRTGVILQVAQVARIDLTLQTGQLTETVEVVGNSPILETQTSSRGAVIDEKQDRRAPAERAGLQPARAAVAGRPARHAAARERQFQGRAERQRQPHVQQRVPARRRRQHLVLELVPRRERAARPAVDRSASGIQDPDERVLGGVRPELRRRRQRGHQVRYEHAPGKRV